MKDIKKQMQPVAKVALAQRVVQLISFLQLELAQRKKTVGAAAQIFISAGRQCADGQGLPGWRGLRRRLGGQQALRARVGAQSRLSHESFGQQEFLHKAAGHQAFTAFT